MRWIGHFQRGQGASRGDSSRAAGSLLELGGAHRPRGGGPAGGGSGLTRVRPAPGGLALLPVAGGLLSSAGSPPQGEAGTAPS